MYPDRLWKGKNVVEQCRIDDKSDSESDSDSNSQPDGSEDNKLEDEVYSFILCTTGILLLTHM